MSERGARGLARNDPPPQLIWRVRTNQQPGLASTPAQAGAALCSTPSPSLNTSLFPRSPAQVHPSPHPELGCSNPAFRPLLPSARPRSRIAGTGAGDQGTAGAAYGHGLRAPNLRASRPRVCESRRTPLSGHAGGSSSRALWHVPTTRCPSWTEARGRGDPRAWWRDPGKGPG